MELSGSHTFNAPRHVVWKALLDPEVLARVMPGCEKLEQVGENEYEGAIKIKVGPVQGNFQGKVTLSNINEPDSYSMAVDGKGAPGFMKGEGHVRLETEGDSTVMHYSGTAQVGGRIASVGQRLLDSSAKALTRQSLENLDKQIQALAQADSGAGAATSAGGDAEPSQPAAPPAQVEAPSQTEFAVGVAKNMLADMIPPERRPLVIGAGAVILVIVAWVIWNMAG